MSSQSFVVPKSVRIITLCWGCVVILPWSLFMAGVLSQRQPNNTADGFVFLSAALVGLGTAIHVGLLFLINDDIDFEHYKTRPPATVIDLILQVGPILTLLALCVSTVIIGATAGYGKINPENQLAFAGFILSFVSPVLSFLSLDRFSGFNRAAHQNWQATAAKDRCEIYKIYIRLTSMGIVATVFGYGVGVIFLGPFVYVPLASMDWMFTVDISAGNPAPQIPYPMASSSVAKGPSSDPEWQRARESGQDLNFRTIGA
jgi:hypothetical protein